MRAALATIGSRSRCGDTVPSRLWYILWKREKVDGGVINGDDDDEEEEEKEDSLEISRKAREWERGKRID